MAPRSLGMAALGSRLALLASTVLACSAGEQPSAAQPAPQEPATAPVAQVAQPEVAQAEPGPAREHTTTPDTAEPPRWPAACATELHQIVDDLIQRGQVFPYTYIYACPAPLQATSHPKYVHDACTDLAVEASFQGPNDPEHIYLAIEALDANTGTPAPTRGMMPWARERATVTWTRVEEHERVYLYRRSPTRIVLIRLVGTAHASPRADAYLHALQTASDRCLES